MSLCGGGSGSAAAAGLVSLCGGGSGSAAAAVFVSCWRRAAATHVGAAAAGGGFWFVGVGGFVVEDHVM